jgi:hypothetical protein
MGLVEKFSGRGEEQPCSGSDTQLIDSELNFLYNENGITKSGVFYGADRLYG